MNARPLCRAAAALLLSASLSATGAPLDAAGAKRLFNDRGCNACHETGEQRIGPPYQAVALRYSADHERDPAAVEAALAAKIRFGGAGAWGFVPMISNPAIDQDEALRITRWIMGLKEAGSE